MSLDSSSSNRETPLKDLPPRIVSDKSVAASRGFQQFRRFLGPLSVLFVLVVIGGYFVTKNSNQLIHASSEPDPLASSRQAVPNLLFTDFDGKNLNLESLRGSVILIGFWTSDCSTCIMELPEFQELYNRYRSNGLKVLTLNLDNRELGDKSTREIWKRGGFSFNSFSDSDRQISNALRIETLPSAVVLDRKGRLAFSSFGANDWRSPETTQLIEDLLLEE